MSRTHKDKKLALRYPEWRYDFDDIQYSVVEVTSTYHYTYKDGERVKVEYAKPKHYTIVKYIKGKTRKTKKKRHFVEKYYHMYSSAPSWWTRLTMNRPKRRACRVWERKVLFQDVETADCPDYGNKPFNYYY